MKAWVESIGESSRPAAERLLAQLDAAGVECRTEARGGRCGILVFARRVARAIDRCASLRDQGVERQLVVAERRAALNDAAIWTLLARGASDVLCLEDLEQPARAIGARIERWRAVDHILSSPQVTANLVGSSGVWRAALREVVEVAHFTDASVIVGGESGTGKELVARLIHTLDPRPDKGQLVLVDCTTLRPELSGSELFGHQRGAFSGAHSVRDGALAMADGGTLFLDEIGELPPALQAELLRAVQEGSYKRLGSNRWRRSSFRLVCATHRDLPADIAAGRFRADLYHRLATWTCRLPPLAERRADIPALVDHFLAQVLGHRPAIDAALISWLEARDYPGNVRELGQLVARIAHRHVGDGAITAGDLPVEERRRPAALATAPTAAGDRAWHGRRLEQAVRRALDAGAGLKAIRERAADAAVRLAVAAAPDQKSAAARLGISPRAVQMRLAAMRRAEAQAAPAD